MFIFCIRRRMFVNFLKYSMDFLVQTSFSSMFIVESDCNLIAAKYVLYTIITEKSFQRLTIQSVVFSA